MCFHHRCIQKKSQRHINITEHGTWEWVRASLRSSSLVSLLSVTSLTEGQSTSTSPCKYLVTGTFFLYHLTHSSVACHLSKNSPELCELIIALESLSYNLSISYGWKNLWAEDPGTLEFKVKLYYEAMTWFWTWFSVSASIKWGS